MIIGFDFDDVLMDTNEWLCLFHNAHYGTSLTKEDVTSYALEEVWKTSRAEAVRRVHEFFYSPQHEVTQPVKGAVEVIRRLQERHKVFIITSRPESVSAQTYACLSRHFPPLVHSLHHANHFWHSEGAGTKGEICRRLGVELFMDDAYHHVEEVASVVRQVFLFDAPWNRKLVPTHPNIQRVYSWDAVMCAIEGL